MTHKVFAKAPTAMKLILLLGVVSLLGDIIYEGGRSVTGPYLLFLGASAFTVAWVSGLGEFIGYAIRLVSGYFADRTREYWTFSLAGYLMIGAIPLLVYTRSWEAAVVLLLIERLGKGIRSPAKDTILSHAAHQVGRGWGFGIHEAMDQIGAVAGPFVFAASLLLLGGYGEGFALLTIPFVLLIAALVLAWRRYPDPASMEESALSFGYTPKDPRVLLPYGAFTVLTMAGVLVFPLMAYHFSAAAVVPDPQIPIFFAVAMATDALAALLMGRLYDRWGLPVIIAIPIANIPIAPLAFSSGYFGALAAAVLWGVSMGGQETVLRAALADFTSIGKRGFAYGIFNTLYGASWFAGSLVFGLLYYVGAGAICAFSIFMQVAAMGAFFLLWRCAGRSSRGYSP